MPEVAFLYKSDLLSKLLDAPALSRCLGLVFSFSIEILRQAGAGQGWVVESLVLTDKVILGLDSNPSQLQELSGLEDAALAVPMQKQNPQFFCAVEVVLPAYGCTSPGVGISEEPLPQLEEGLSLAQGGHQEWICHLSIGPSVFSSFSSLVS